MSRTKSIKALQVNTNKCYESASAIMDFANNKETDISFIQEPNIQGGKVRGFKRTHQVIYETSNTKVVTIILNKQIQALFIKNLSDENIVTIEINTAEICNLLH